MSACDTIDIHGIGKIQDYGYVVCVEKDSLDVSHVSSNICDLPFSIKASPVEYIDSDFGACFYGEVCEHMEKMILSRELRIENFDSDNLSFDSYFVLNNESFLFSLDETFSTYIYSITANCLPEFDTGSVYSDFIQKLFSCVDQENLFEEACMPVVDMVGYERAMVYKFHEDFSGEVVFEWIDPSIKGSIDPYIGMHFPESDIPLPARQMYLSKPIRIIHDTSSQPVTIIGESRLNLSKCLLRASHDVHITYMKNMGIKSSLSLAIADGSDLWGILSFHSYQNVRRPHHSMTRIIESMSMPLSMMLSNMVKAANTKRERELIDVVDKMILCEHISDYISKNHMDIFRLTGTHSVHVQTSDGLQSWGEYRAGCEDVVVMDIEKFKKRAYKTGFYVGVTRKPTKGFIYFIHGRVSIIFYRNSKNVEEVWGGDPGYLKLRRPDGLPGPRGSFERYIVHNNGILDPWTDSDRKVACLMYEKMSMYLLSINTHRSDLSYSKDPLVSTSTYTTLNSGAVDHSLLSYMSHEMLTPLNGVYNAIKIVIEDRDMERIEIEQVLSQGLECVKSIKSSLNGVLSISGSQSDGYVDTEISQKVYSNVNTIGESVESDYSERLKNKGIRLSIDSLVGKDHECLMGGKISAIKQCVFSAIENSIRFTGRGGAILYAVSYNHTHREAVMSWNTVVSKYENKNITNVDSVMKEDDTRTWYTFTVCDTGCGVHPDMMYNMIKTIDLSKGGSGKAIDKSHQGIGLGLYKGMLDVMKMKGTVAIASTSTVGTYISFIVPIQEGQIPCDPRDLDPGVPDGVFFVVDDSSLNRKMTSRLLKMACKKSMGFEPNVREFSDGSVCMEEVHRMRDAGEAPLCIIMDHHMPIMSGKETTEKIRHLEKEKHLPSVPIVGYTADVTDKTRKDLLSSGMDTVLSKPISMETLTTMCQKIYGTDI